MEQMFGNGLASCQNGQQHLTQTRRKQGFKAVTG
jgi:hypothetical protein